MNDKISLGLINFTNCLPINHTLYVWRLEKITMSEGYPTLINQLMLDKQLHAAPISSVEYLNNKDKYSLIETACISSDGEVGSVVLFSNYKLQELKGKRIGIPHTSASSIALLKVLLNEHKIDICDIKFQYHRYEQSLGDSLINKFDAILYIGDVALAANINYQNIAYKYDLGHLWKKVTGYPMVFGTWVAQSEWKNSNQSDFEWISFIIDKAVEAGLNMYFNEVLNLASKTLNLNAEHINDYLTRKILYTFSEDHKKSLELFGSLHASLNEKVGLLTTASFDSRNV